jgi:thiol:disulfide interchange protein
MLSRWCLILLAVLAAGCGGLPANRAPERPGGAPGRPIAWLDSYEKAVASARQAGKPLMADVSTSWCSACKRLDEEVFSRPDVAAASEAFMCVRVDGDKRADLVKKFKVSGYPTIVFLDQHGKELGRVRGAVPYQVMLEEMKRAAGQAGAGKPSTRSAAGEASSGRQ